MMHASAVGNIRALDMLFLEDLLGMGGGYVLEFSDSTFAQFFAEEVGINIDDPAWAAKGGSKGKRMRLFLQTADKPTVVRALKALWEYREAARERAGEAETVKDARGRLLAVIAQLEGRSRPASASGDPRRSEPASPADPQKVAKLKADLLALSSRAPQARGYAFETLLTKLFDAHGLAAREPFRLRGEQIDGSLSSATRSTSSRPNGRTRWWVSRNCTPSTARSSRKRPGPGVSSSAMPASPTTGWRPLAAARRSCAWTAWTSSRRWTEASRSTSSCDRKVRRAAEGSVRGDVNLTACGRAGR